MPLENKTILAHDLLAEMYLDGYFPNPLVDKLKQILLDVCGQIETQKPADDAAVIAITHAATRRINDLQEEFWNQGSEIETGARDCIGMDFDFIARAYGFDIDVEALISPRDW